MTTIFGWIEMVSFSNKDMVSENLNRITLERMIEKNTLDRLSRSPDDIKKYFVRSIDRENLRMPENIQSPKIIRRLQIFL